MSNNKVIVKGTSGSTLWFIAILILKIAKVVDWTWFFTFVVALAPIILILGIIAILYLFIFFVLCFDSLKDYIHKSKTTRNEYH